MRIQTWNYHLPYCQRGDGGTFYIDTSGVFMSYGAYGAYGYRWTSIGAPCIRSFIAQINPDYAYSKFCHDLGRRREVFDGEATARAIRKYLYKLDVEELPGWWQDEIALLNEVRSFGDDPEAFGEWLRATHIDQHYAVEYFYQTAREPECWAFCTKLLPRLQARLRFDLAREKRQREQSIARPERGRAWISEFF